MLIDRYSISSVLGVRQSLHGQLHPPGRRHSCFFFRIRAFILLLAAAWVSGTAGNDLYRTAGGARSVSSGGIALLAGDPLSAMSNNPALLTGQTAELQFSGQALVVDADFQSSLGETDTAERGPGLLPEIAFVRPLKGTDVTLGGLFMLRSALRAEFDFEDPPGNSGVSYGNQRHLSEYVVLEGSAGVGWQLSPRLSIGASLGMLYNRNILQAPFIFQSHPMLTGLKVLVDLEADDFALTGRIGASYKLSSALDLSISYSAESDFDSQGDLSGNLSQLGLGIAPEFFYNAEVRTATPATLSTALSWSVNSRLAAAVQLDWIAWSNAFDSLRLEFTKGSNEQLNEFLAGESILDVVPLDWRDQLSIQLGVTYQVAADLTVRAGLGFDDVPVPEHTFTPLTGAIMDRSLSLGITSNFAKGELDIGYRFSNGSEFTVGQTGLAGGEYAGSRLKLKLHSLIMSYSF